MPGARWFVDKPTPLSFRTSDRCHWCGNPYPLARRDPCVPPPECDFPRRGDVGIAPYEGAGGRVRTLGVGDGVLPWSAAEQMPLVRRPVSAAVPRCEAPSGRGLSAQPTEGEKTVWNLSLRQRFALPPPSQREARGIHIPLRGGTHGSRPTVSDICDRAVFLTD